MKKNKLLAYVLFSGLLAIPAVMAMEKIDDNPNPVNFKARKQQLKNFVEEDYKTNFFAYHQKAIEYAERLPAPHLANVNDVDINVGFMKLNLNLSGVKAMGDTAFWNTAINNFKGVMDKYPIPPENDWLNRGPVKQYNEYLLKTIQDNIEAQKKTLLADLLKGNPQDHRKKGQKITNKNSWDPALETFLNQRITRSLQQKAKEGYLKGKITKEVLFSLGETSFNQQWDYWNTNVKS